jgi:hypothetical protein
MRIPDRVLQLIGGAYFVVLVLAFLKGLREGWGQDSQGRSERDVALSTTHPAVPRNLFSAMLEKEGRPELRHFRSDDWLLGFGDKLCHSTGSLLLCLQQGVETDRSDLPSRKELFPLFLEAALAEARPGLQRHGGEEALQCLTLTILDRPPQALQYYPEMLGLSEEERLERVAGLAVQLAGAPSRARRHYRAAFVLLRLMVTAMV